MVNSGSGFGCSPASRLRRTNVQVSPAQARKASSPTSEDSFVERAATTTSKVCGFAADGSFEGAESDVSWGHVMMDPED